MEPEEPDQRAIRRGGIGRPSLSAQHKCRAWCERAVGSAYSGQNERVLRRNLFKMLKTTGLKPTREKERWKAYTFLKARADK